MSASAAAAIESIIVSVVSTTKRPYLFSYLFASVSVFFVFLACFLGFWFRLESVGLLPV